MTDEIMFELVNEVNNFIVNDYTKFNKLLKVVNVKNSDEAISLSSCRNFEEYSNSIKYEIVVIELMKIIFQKYALLYLISGTEAPLQFNGYVTDIDSLECFVKLAIRGVIYNYGLYICELQSIVVFHFDFKMLIFYNENKSFELLINLAKIANIDLEY